MRIQLHTSEQGRKNHNHAAERDIGFLTKQRKLQMQKKRVLKRLWDFGLVVESKILTQIPHGQDLRTGYEEVTGQTANIREWLDFECYDLVYCYDRTNNPDVSEDVRRLAYS